MNAVKRVRAVPITASMRLLPAVTLTAASFTLLTSAASAATLTAVVPNAKTSDPGAWSPAMMPVDGDTLVIPEPWPVTIDRDLRLGGLVTNPATILRLSPNIVLAIDAPTDLRDLSIVGTPTSRIVLGEDATIGGTVKVLGGPTIDSLRDLTFTDGAAISTSGGPSGQGPVFSLERGSARVKGAVTQTAPPNVLRPIFGVKETAVLTYEGAVTQNPDFLTVSDGTVVVEGGAKLGRMQATGRLELRRGQTSRMIDLGDTDLNDADVRFVQGQDGLFPTLTGATDVNAHTSKIRPVADPSADQAAAPQRQQLAGDPTPFPYQANVFSDGRIDASSTWLAESVEGFNVFVTRHALTAKAGEPAVIVPAGAQPVGTVLHCRAGEYSTEVQPVAVTFLRDGVEVGTNGAYTLTEADRGHEITCRMTVEGLYGNRLEVAAYGAVTVAAPVVEEPTTPTTPSTPESPAKPAPDVPSPAAETPATPAPSTTPAPAAAANAPAKPAAPAARAKGTTTALPAITAPAATPATCPSIATLEDIQSAWRSADGQRAQGTLTGSSAPGVWRCRVTGTEDGQPVVLRSLPVLVANGQRAMFDRETVQAERLSDPTLLSSGAQRISARLYARKADSKLGTRTTRFTQRVHRGENAVGFTRHVGAKLPKGRYKLVVRAITEDGVSAPLIQEVTIG